ncbi:MAG: hypothetical protein HOH43_07900 [Candidatus Latescibacteria bacterium]|jgi:hypothetical protein|nr:hypothetical protein [Candidatus Latescibacterota bacterium]
MNEKIYAMFEDYSQKFKRKWGKIFHDGQEAIERALGAAAEENGCTIQKCGNDFLWKNRKNQSEALFRFIPDSTDISLFQDIYRKIEQTRSPITFVVVHQTVDGEGNYDVFRFSEKSFLEHNNRPRYRKK